MITLEDMDALKKLAEAATPGPWIAAGPSFGAARPQYLSDVVVDNPNADEHEETVCATISGTTHEGTADMEFIAAANPATVLQLIAEIERLRALSSPPAGRQGGQS